MHEGKMSFCWNYKWLRADFGGCWAELECARGVSDNISLEAGGDGQDSQHHSVMARKMIWGKVATQNYN